MFKIESNKTLCGIIKIFYQLGIWQIENVTIRIKSKKLLHWFNYVLFQIFLVACAFLSDDREEFVFLFEIEIVVSVISIKLMYLLWKEKEILTFLYDPILAHPDADTEMSMKINKKLKMFMKFVYSYLLMAYVSFVFYIISSLPIFSTKKMLPLFINFNLNLKYSEVVYWILYFLIVSWILYSNVSTHITIIIGYVMLNYSIAYHVLASQLKRLGLNAMEKKLVDLRNNSNSHPPTKTQFFQDLVRLIRAHQNIFQYESNYLLNFNS